MNYKDKKILRYSFFALNEDLSKWFNLSSRYDRESLPNTDSMQISTWKIPKEEKVLFQRDISSWDDADEGLIITDTALYYTPSKSYIEIYRYLWDEVSRIDFDGTNFIVHGMSSVILTLAPKYFFYGNEGTAYYQKLAKLLTHFIQIPYYYQINSINTDIGNLDVLVKACYDKNPAPSPFSQNYKFVNGIPVSSYAEMIAAYTLENAKYKKDSQELIAKLSDVSISNDIEKLNDQFSVADNLYKQSINISLVHLVRAHYYHTIGLLSKARNAFASALFVCDRDQKKAIFSSLVFEEEDLIAKGIWNEPEESSTHNLLITASDSSFVDGDFKNAQVYRIANVPSFFKFPFGHPKENVLYVKHPLNSYRYIPYESSDDCLFMERISEYCTILQCLGATEIEIFFEKGMTMNELSKKIEEQTTDGDFKIASFNYKTTNEGNTNTNNSEKVKRHVRYVYDPISRPNIPKGMQWLEVSQNWKTMISRRLESNMLEMEEDFFNSKINNLTNEDKETIEAVGKLFKLSGNHEGKTTKSTESSSHIETQWKIKAKFRSLKDWE